MFESAEMLSLVQARQRYMQAIEGLRRNDSVDALLREELSQAIQRIDAKLAAVGDKILASTD